MDKKELDESWRDKLIEDRGMRHLINLSSTFTLLIQTAGKCEFYSSDILYDIEDIKQAVETVQLGKSINLYLGFRMSGVDHTAFVYNSPRDKYMKLLEVVVSCYEPEYISVEVNRLF